MGLTPLDIHNKEFPKRFRGYHPDTVDEFLDQVIREMESMVKETARHKEQVDDLTMKLDQYRNLEETINKTLVVAQEAADDVKSNARKEADLIIQEARLQAERIMEAGQVKARRIVEENADLSRVVATLRTQVKSLLQAQLQSLEGLYDPFTKAAAAQLPPESES
jgi:cell division initiation protein